MDTSSIKPKIVVIGIGHPGINTINELMEHNITDLKYVAIDSYDFELEKSKVAIRINLERHLPRGLGTLGTPTNCRKAAEKEQELIQAQLQDADATIMIAGLGGNTGAGVAPILSSLAINHCPLNIFVGVIPFEFEGRKRLKKANDSLKEIRDSAAKIIMIKPDDIFTGENKKLSIKQGFSIIDKILCKTVCHIYDNLQEEYSKYYRFTTITGILPCEGLIYADIDNNNVSSVSIKETDKIEFYFENIIPDRFILNTPGLPIYVKRPDITSSDVDNRADFIDIPEWMKKPMHKSPEPRPDGKEICRRLRTMRLELAKVNNIPFQSEECTYDGPCAGTCEKCEQEALYLRDKLNELSEAERIYPQYLIGKVDDVL